MSAYRRGMEKRDEERRYDVLAEQTISELKAIREYVSDIPGIKEDVAELKDDVSDLKSDMQVVTATVRDHARRIRPTGR